MQVRIVPRSSPSLLVITIALLGVCATATTTRVIQGWVGVKYPVGSPPMLHPEASIFMQGAVKCSEVALFLTSPVGRESVALECNREFYFQISPADPLKELRRYELEYRIRKRLVKHEIFTTKRKELPILAAPRLIRVDYTPPTNQCSHKVRFTIKPHGGSDYPSLIVLQWFFAEVQEWRTLKGEMVLPEDGYEEFAFTFTRCELHPRFRDLPRGGRVFPTGKSLVRLAVRDVFLRESIGAPFPVDIPEQESNDSDG